jgi:hypothetical protein
MNTVPMRLRAAILALMIGALVACTPGGGGGASAPAGSTGTVPSTGTAPSTAPASMAPSPSGSVSGQPGY